MRHLLAPAALVAAFVFLAPLLWAQDVPRGLGHPSAGALHRYSTECCNAKDCEPVEDAAVKETPLGYEVRYMTTRGFVASGFIPYGDKRIKEPLDEKFHVCSLPQYTEPEGRLLCIYPKFVGG
jgi:hypothetical protein